MKEGYVYLHNNVFSSLLALSNKEQETGLMFQENPPIMSFIYLSPKINKFWMHNTPAPLDIVFCHKNKITQIHKGIPFSTQIIGNDEFSDLVIELPYGTVKSSNIKLGNNAGLVSPSFEEIKKIIGS